MKPITLIFLVCLFTINYCYSQTDLLRLNLKGNVKSIIETKTFPESKPQEILLNFSETGFLENIDLNSIDFDYPRNIISIYDEKGIEPPGLSKNLDSISEIFDSLNRRISYTKYITTYDDQLNDTINSYIRWKYTYDSLKNVTEFHMRSNGMFAIEEKQRYEYIYDEYGNWIQMNLFMNNKNMYTIIERTYQRKIIYY